MAKPDWEIVADMVDAGKTREEIIEALNLMPSKLTWIIRKARINGRSVRLVYRGSKRVQIERAMEGKNTGQVGALLRKLDTPIVEWLAAQIPEGATLADVVASIVVDAYLEEVTPSTATPDSSTPTQP